MTKPSRAWEIYIKATPERIWDAFVNPDMISRWSHDTRPTSEIRAGATVTYVLPDGTEASRIEVLDFQPGRRIQMRAQMLFHPDMREDPPYMLTWELEAVSPRVTRVTVTAEFEAENATFRLISGGQQPILDDLKTLLETGETMWAA